MRATPSCISRRIVLAEATGQWFTIKGLVTSLTALLCVITFSNLVSGGAFPAVLPDMAKSAALADWQLGLVAGAFGFARMVADVPLGLFLTHNLRRAMWLGPLVLAIGALCLTSGGGFPILVLGRLLMGLGQALSMMGGLTAILRFQSGKSLASALNAYELSAMIGMLGGIIMIGALPSSLAWNTALLLTCAPQLIGLLVIPKLVAALPAHDGPLFARQMTSAATVKPAAPHAVPRDGASLVPLVFAAGGLVALAYSTMEQFLIPLRASREFGLERTGVARLLMVQQLFDIAALIPVGLLADRRGAARVLPFILLMMAAANALVGFGSLPLVVVGCALFGLSMAGWMLPLGVLRQETPAEHIAWRTGLYRVCVDGGIFLGPFLSGVLGMRHAGFLPAFWTLALAVTGLLLLARARRSSTMAVHG
jgi:MFS family permease